MKIPVEERHGGEYICTSCGYVGDLRSVTKGSFLIELVLWLFFLIPGLIYTLWRLTSKHYACPKCGNQTMIPIDTPRGVELVKSWGIKALKIDKQENTNEPKKKSRISLIGVLVIAFIIFILAWIGSFSTEDSNSSNQTQQSQRETAVKQGKFLEYNYTIIQEGGGNRYTATFTPFLPRDDMVIKGMMFEIVKQIYGKNTVRDLQPKIVERNGQNLLLLEGVKTNYLFLLVKEDTGEVHSFVFWNE